MNVSHLEYIVKMLNLPKKKKGATMNDCLLVHSPYFRAVSIGLGLLQFLHKFVTNPSSPPLVL